MRGDNKGILILFAYRNDGYRSVGFYSNFLINSNVFKLII